MKAADQRAKSGQFLSQNSDLLVLMADPNSEPERKRQRLHTHLAHIASVHDCQPDIGTKIVTAPPPPIFITGNHQVTIHRFLNSIGNSAVCRILLNVWDREGKVVQFKIHKYTRLGKLMDKYCERIGLPASNLRFMVEDGRCIGPDDTAETQGLEDEDIIIAVQASP